MAKIVSFFCFAKTSIIFQYLRLIKREGRKGQNCRFARQMHDRKRKHPINPKINRVLCGTDGTRTRDLRRDRAAF